MEVGRWKMGDGRLEMEDWRWKMGIQIIKLTILYKRN
jgi:hypothetical protein